MLVGDPALLPLLARMALLVDEDVCVLRDGVLVAGCVCAPSHWRLREKVGKPLGAVHAPVPGYDVELADKVDRLVARLRPGVAVVRRNWTIHETSARYEPHAPEPLSVTPADQWLRTERQTLLRLPRSGAVLFGIRTDMVPLRHVPPPVKQALAARLAAEPEALRRYHVQGRAPDLIEYLQQ